jgi:hypothetical protein
MAQNRQPAYPKSVDQKYRLSYGVTTHNFSGASRPDNGAKQSKNYAALYVLSEIFEVVKIIFMYIQTKKAERKLKPERWILYIDTVCPQIVHLWQKDLCFSRR